MSGESVCVWVAACIQLVNPSCCMQCGGCPVRAHQLHPVLPLPLPLPCPLRCSESLVVGNTVNPAVQGVGGGLYLGRDGFSVAATLLEGNRAHYGGGLFISADLSRNAALAYLNMSGNVAAMGSAVFWCGRCTAHCTALLCSVLHISLLLAVPLT